LSQTISQGEKTSLQLFSVNLIAVW